MSNREHTAVDLSLWEGRKQSIDPLCSAHTVSDYVNEQLAKVQDPKEGHLLLLWFKQCCTRCCSTLSKCWTMQPSAWGTKNSHWHQMAEGVLRLWWASAGPQPSFPWIQHSQSPEQEAESRMSSPSPVQGKEWRLWPDTICTCTPCHGLCVSWEQKEGIARNFFRCVPAADENSCYYFDPVKWQLRHMQDWQHLHKEGFQGQPETAVMQTQGWPRPRW